MSADIINIQDGVMMAALGWVLLVAYQRNGCIKRLEQKIDSFIDEYRNNHE